MIISLHALEFNTSGNETENVASEKTNMWCSEDSGVILEKFVAKPRKIIKNKVAFCS